MVNNELEDFFRNNSNSFVVLSLFLLITFELSQSNEKITLVLSLLSAFISYLILMSILPSSGEKPLKSLTGGIITSIFIFFTLVFCIWVLMNLIDYKNEFSSILMAIVWISFIAAIPYKGSSRIGKILIILFGMIAVLYILASTIFF